MYVEELVWIIIDFRPSIDAWKVVTKDKSGAESIRSRITGNNHEVEPKLQCLSFFGIIRYVPEDLNENNLCDLIANCTKATQIQNTRSLKLVFESKEDLESSIRSPPIIEYERLPISVFQGLPPQHFSCQSHGDFASACSGTRKYSRRGEAGVSTTKGNPYIKVHKFSLCISSDNPCYSFKCPVAQFLLKKLQWMKKP